jgi:hypothetical protein
MSKLFPIVDIAISFDDASGNPAEIAMSAFFKAILQQPIRK